MDTSTLVVCVSKGSQEPKYSVYTSPSSHLPNGGRTGCLREYDLVRFHLLSDRLFDRRTRGAELRQKRRGLRARLFEELRNTTDSRPKGYGYMLTRSSG